ncbi:MAG: sigma-E factor negative regulatory protein [Pseudomonadales bacterium]|nr:sigma-E factor negative regulatory protein [Pseudomonadales bacterium]
MSDYEKESLSALMDGETDELELRRILKSMESEPELAERWQRYHLAQSILHERGVPVTADIATGVAAALQAEPALDNASKTSSLTPQWRQQLARVAIAASVAVVAVVALQPDVSNPQQAPALVQEAGNTVPDRESTTAVTLIADAPNSAAEAEAQQRLREYIEAMRFDPEEPVRMEHIQESPLYRLVNEYQAQP